MSWTSNGDDETSCEGKYGGDCLRTVRPLPLRASQESWAVLYENRVHRRLSMGTASVTEPGLRASMLTGPYMSVIYARANDAYTQ